MEIELQPAAHGDSSAGQPLRRIVLSELPQESLTLKGDYRETDTMDESNRRDAGTTASKKFSLIEWFSVRLRPVADLRDGLLVAASVTYVVGYMVWSYNAFRNKLGMLPALDPQYFVAGLAPMFILSAAYVAARLLKRFFVDIWPAWVGTKATGFGRVLRIALILGFWGFFGLMILGPILGLAVLLVFLGYRLRERFANRRSVRPGDEEAEKISDEKADGKTDEKMRGWKQAALIGLGLLLAAVAVFLISKKDYLSQMALGEYFKIINDISIYGTMVTIALLPPTDVTFLNWVSKIYRFYWIYAGALVLLVAGIVFYLEEVYPRLPQEFGGVRARCAYLDIVKAQVSKETLEGVVPSEALSSIDQVVRSLQIEILYSGSSVMLLRSNDKVYEINRSLIQTVNACD